jgi:hypothetical protein
LKLFLLNLNLFCLFALGSQPCQQQQTTPPTPPKTSPTTMRVLSVVALAAFALASSSASLDHNTRKAEREAKHAVNEGAAAADGVFASASRAAGEAANVSASLLPSRFYFVVTGLVLMSALPATHIKLSVMLS